MAVHGRAVASAASKVANAGSVATVVLGRHGLVAWDASPSCPWTSRTVPTGAPRTGAAKSTGVRPADFPAGRGLTVALGPSLGPQALDPTARTGSMTVATALRSVPG